ncbi:hypothetical protein GMDG_05640 [Pseudogymnoascus destructans 20631-21]|uniref:EGF-like domain-containing protein n=1 Tax=Pseudogymnoascus destructans (strain ATCC MYA-4855 / 20631-21) TaxID=658429 RepID=L8FSL5_PSED2|nr:hypothetical protein GMDG_05640 [Pseudogymnoascus destructans 20631-21]
MDLLPIQKPSDISRGGGSVKRAREQVERERLQMTSESPRMRQAQQQARGENRPRQPLPQAITASRTGQGIGAAISRPTPAPQRPLPSQTGRPQMNDNAQQYQPPSGRGKAPQRPPRPSHVPSILDASKLQDHTPSFPYQPKPGPSQPGSQSREAQQHLDEMRSPDVLSPVTPMTMQSRASTNSSIGTIPDFPVPVTGANYSTTGLGPPPSSRRGPSSYYSMQPFVPIPEEIPKAPTAAHGSYASSTAIPSNWGAMGYGYETDQQALFDKEMMMDEGAESSEGVRSASVGKRAKPPIILRKDQQVKTPLQSRGGVLEKTRHLRVVGGAERKGMPKRADDAQGGMMMVPMAMQRDTTWPTFGLDSPTEGNKELGDLLSSSDSDSTLTSSPTAIEMEKLAPIAAVPAAVMMNSRSPSGSPFDMGGGEREIQYSRNSAIRLPSRLNMDTVRDAEARGSLTSLPDLIRRATRLASMMNEGKRPASRLNDLNDFPPPGGEKGRAGNGRHRNTPSGISGMLAAFPPPGLATPVETPKSRSRWPAYESSLADLRTRNGRRCCGMPICWFLILLIALLLVITAAIVIPLELLVPNKKGDANKNLSALEVCEKDSKCNNGGQSIINGGVCSCICVNSFTGTNCGDKSAVGCTTVNFTSTATSPADAKTYTDVTIGAAIPALIKNAVAGYNIPLDFAKVVSRFSDAGLSCDAQNAIVSFNPGAVSESAVAGGTSSKTPTATAVETGPTSIVKGSGAKRRAEEADARLAPRMESPLPNVAEPTGIHASSSTPPTSTPTSSSSSASAAKAAAAANFTVTGSTLDFSRTAVLYILQTLSLDAAAVAQTKITLFLVGNVYTGMGNVTVGNGVSVDFLGRKVDAGEGWWGVG